MALTFLDTHNMNAFPTKSDASKGFEQIIDFLSTSVIQYALMVNFTIYVFCIKQFWSFVSLKKTNDVVRLKALIDRRKVIITEDMVRQALRLDDPDSIDCLPNEEIFAELSRMGVGKGFSRVDTLLFDGMLVPHKVQDEGKIAELDADEDVTLETIAAEDVDVQGRLPESQAQVYHLDLEHAQKVLKVVTTAAATTTVATTITATSMPKASASRRKRDIIPIFEKDFNSIMAFQEKREKEIEEEASKQSKRKIKSFEQKVAKKQRIDEEVEELKTHL
uniref:Xylulose kinase-1 n=1 Tax=Tanacetum cinerariifolium TaxID=118510 RepID=A0A6L2JK56_TANCI|nr:hypothetical protein [Tanacetum cinerariifolium]